MEEMNIGVVVRTYSQNGNFKETHYNNVSYRNMRADIIPDLIAGEIVCVKLTPNIAAFYFKVPVDWPENWTKMGALDSDGLSEN